MKNIDQDLLITRYLDDQASDEEVDILNQLLETNLDTRDRFLSATTQAFMIAQGVTELDQRKKSFPVRKAVLFSTLAACLVFALITVFSLKTELPLKPEREEGIARLIDSGGQVELPSIDRLFSGDTIKTLGANSFLKIEFRDGTVLHLNGDTTATVTGGKQKKLLLHVGAAALSVSPQPINFPLLVTTPVAELTVKGTSFSVLSDRTQTHLEVTEGLVDLTRVVDGDSVLVEEGQYSIVDANDDEDCWVKPIPLVSEKWNADFRSSFRSMVQYGVHDEHGIREGPFENGISGIALENVWTGGDYAYFKLGENSKLKVRLKMDQPSWLNFFVLYRSPDYSFARPQTCLYQDENWWKGLKPGEWRTIEIPLTNPKFTEEDIFMKDNVPIGWYSFALFMSSGQETRGLVIEKMWIE